MIGTIKAGVGSPGKLWTGDSPAEGPAVVSIIERVCPCGATTRKFRAAPLVTGADRAILDHAADWPVIFVATGGVGSLVDTSPGGIEKRYASGHAARAAGLACWNWSNRVGGWVIVSPVAVAGGYVAKTDLPPAREGYVWLHTYAGDTLSEYVLLRADLASHAIPVVSLDGTCPPCRERAAAEPVAEPAGEPGRLAFHVEAERAETAP